LKPLYYLLSNSFFKGKSQHKTEKIVLDIRPHDSKDREELSILATISPPNAATINITSRQSSRIRYAPFHLSC